MCQVLDYAAARRGGVGDLLWGPLFGMRDELREIAPGVLLGPIAIFQPLPALAHAAAASSPSTYGCSL